MLKSYLAKLLSGWEAFDVGVAQALLGGNAGIIKWQELFS